jgi:hypothetical protein
MRRRITILAILTALALPAAAEDKKEPEARPARPVITRKTVDPLPDSAAKFSGVLVGRVVTKDVEKGTLVLNVDAVPRQWGKAKCENPRSVIGKNIAIDGVSGRFLDILLLARDGDTLELGARHDGGSGLTFPGELFRKAAPFKAEDYPILPEDFRGFTGAVSGKIVKKSSEKLELIVEIEGVLDVWKKNGAKKPDSIKGKQAMVTGFWRRKEQYHELKVGDRIEFGIQHPIPRSDHLTVAEFIRKPRTETAGKDKPRASRKGTEKSEGGLPAGIRRFNGMVVGRLVSKDIEKGTFSVTVDAVPRVWRNSKAEDPKSIIGKTIEIDGVFGKWLDVLLLVKKGETLECEAKHDGGDSLTFPGEMIRKVAPVKPGDYPELPEGFRGFNGFVSGKIVKKDSQLMELMVQIEKVTNTSDKNRAKKPESIVGKKAIVVGFWRKKEAYAGLKVGDTIECALQHITPRSDHLNVGEFRTSRKSKETDKERD